MIRILHVDDEESCHILISYSLLYIEKDLEFTWAESGEAALNLLKNESFDCILSDYQMPIMGGQELLVALRKAGNKTPFIFLTGQGNEQIAIEAFQFGADDYFTKKIGFAHYDRMLNSIKKHINLFKEEFRRKQAEQTIIASEAKYKELVEHASSIILRHESGKITFFNEFAQKFFDFKEEEILGKNVVGTIVPQIDSSGKDLSIMVKDAFSKPKDYEENENENIKKNGERVWVAWQNKMVTNLQTGRKEILSIGRDITERKNIEEKLQESEKRFRLMMQQSPSVIELYDLDGIQIEVNKAYEDLWNFPASTSLNKFNVLKSKEVEETGLIAYVKSAYAGNAVKVPEYKFDSTGKTEANGVGRIRWLSTRIYPLKDKTGKVKNIVINHEDITDLKNKEEEYRLAKEEAVAATKLKDKFISLVAHDLQTPAIIMSTFLQRLLDDKTEPIHDSHRKIIEPILKSAKKMSLLIKDILNISRFKLGKLKSNPKNIDLYSIINEVVSTYKYMAETKGIKLIIKPIDKHVFADPILIKQVIENLISNAVKFSNSNDSITIFSPDNDNIVFAIKDTGIGISPKTLKSIFDYNAHALTKGTLGEIGSGLGLAFCKELMLAQNGDIIIESKEGIGSTFYIKM